MGRVSRYVVKPLDDADAYVVDAPDREALDAHAWAAPASDDACPTGEVSIRFAEPLAGDDLDSFISKHGLQLLRRNEFVPEQVVAAPEAPSGTWLPDVVERLNAEGVVAKAWPNTLARYRR
jgi:hypothetical protein